VLERKVKCMWEKRCGEERAYWCLSSRGAESGKKKRSEKENSRMVFGLRRGRKKLATDAS
jgi:hypothetical protein